MTDLVEFLRARLDEDAEVARTTRKNEQWVPGTDRWFASHGNAITSMAPHRAVAEVEAKRRIIERERWHPHGGLECGGHPGSYLPHGDYGPGYCGRMDEENCTLRDLALPFADHPDYREEWKP